MPNFPQDLEDLQNLDWNMALQLSIKAMNDKCGPDGLVPSMIVFGAVTNIPTPLYSNILA